MTGNHKQFFGKIMLFGEYSLMYGAAALTVPFTKYFAKFLLPSNPMSAQEIDFARKSNKQLQLFLQYLQDLQILEGAGFSFDRIREDLEAGLYLWSNIPNGYGLGSSGALVAAIYSRYAANPYAEPSKTEELLELKSAFAKMEAFFHGSSSGLDPLTSYVNKPLIINSEHNISLVTQNLKPYRKNGGFFLVDTHIPRNTKPLVIAFHEKCQDASFLDKLKTEYFTINNACINSVIENEGSISELMKQLSSLQLEIFEEMIPHGFLDAWAKGLSSGSYTLKLCGAGGGGFLLGFADDFDNISDEFPKQDLVLLSELFGPNPSIQHP